jgi:hypothetical protein
VSRASSTIATCAIDLVVREIVSRRREQVPSIREAVLVEPCPRRISG